MRERERERERERVKKTANFLSFNFERNNHEM